MHTHTYISLMLALTGLETGSRILVGKGINTELVSIQYEQQFTQHLLFTCYFAECLPKDPNITSLEFTCITKKAAINITFKSTCKTESQTHRPSLPRCFRLLLLHIGHTLFGCSPIDCLQILRL